MRFRRRNYALFNLGRDKDPHHTTQRIDLRMLGKLKRALPAKNWVVFFVEINEGDDNDERRAIKAVFPNARLLGATVREPIMVSPDLARLVQDVDVRWVEDTAVEHWSPQRSILRVRLAGGESLLGYHPAAGANGQGDRPERYRRPLQVSWDNAVSAARAIEMAEHAQHRHVTSMLDVNAYDLHTFPQWPTQRTVVHQRTDWGRVWPMNGWTADFEPMSPVDAGLDSHDILRMRGRYREGR